MKFIIKRNDDGKYVAKSGSKHSYTRIFQDFRVYNSRLEAERERCGNETIVPLDPSTTGIE